MLFTGTMIAPGIAIGPAAVWMATAGARREGSVRSAASEWERLQNALDKTQRELEQVASLVVGTAGKSAAAVFTAHALLLSDPELLASIRQKINDERLTAESAVWETFAEHARCLAAVGNPYLAARADDLLELGRGLLNHLDKDGCCPAAHLLRPCVLIAENLGTTDVIALDRSRLLALVLTRTGARSHAALLAATLGVPVVGSVPELLEQAGNGDTVVVDGNHGHVLLHPSELALRQYRTRRYLFENLCGELAGLRDAPAVTPDGRKVWLTANVGLAEEVPHALAQGAEGVGLLRTEYFYLAHGGPPTEEEQYDFYTGVVKAMAPRPVTFRVFDLGGDKASGEAEANPMLGFRGIRLLLGRRAMFEDQLAALLRASRHGPVRIMFPLITSLTEFQDTMQVVDGVKRRLRDRGTPFDDAVPFGCMIETPAAATIPDILASEVEFFSIGSNDLIQYTLAADRTNPHVSHVYEPLHLAVLRMMQAIVQAANSHGRPVSLCGEMAADPIYTIILLGLGVDELSVNPIMLPAIKQVLRSVTWEEARSVAEGVLRERRAKDVQSYLEKMMADRFPHLMSLYGRDGTSMDETVSPAG